MAGKTIFWGNFVFSTLPEFPEIPVSVIHLHVYAMEHSAMPRILNQLGTRNIAYRKSSFFTGPVAHNSRVSSMKSSAGLGLCSRCLTKPIPFLISPTAYVNLCPPAHQPSQ